MNALPSASGFLHHRFFPFSQHEALSGSRVTDLSGPGRHQSATRGDWTTSAEVALNEGEIEGRPSCSQTRSTRCDTGADERHLWR